MTEILTLTSARAVEGDDSVHAGLPEHGALHEVQRFLSSATARRPLTPNEKKAARACQARYLLTTETYKDRWIYEQYRKMRSLGVDPSKGGRSDCSENATASFFWVRHKLGIPVEDPNGLGFNGYGYTGTLLAANVARKIPLDRVFFVGDLAIYGHGSTTTHVVTCRKGGRAVDAIWTSNGSQAGPYPVRLHYRSDLLAVVRPWSYR